MANRMSQALAQAKEYRRLHELGRNAEADQCEEMIRILVGEIHAGRWYLPDLVADTMGRDDLAFVNRTARMAACEAIQKEP